MVDDYEPPVNPLKESPLSVMAAHMERQLSDLREQHKAERAELEGRIIMLEGKLAEMFSSPPTKENSGV